MNPIRLRMKAFGSYLHETEVDFTKLGEHPLFLITGATGGGKTTILDAMCFALYCRSTGGRRSWADMRSLGAPEEEETLVEFSFAYRGAVYRWFRSRKTYYSKRADAKKIKEVHECYRKNSQGAWQLLCSGSETRVRAEAEKLLGLTCEQFSQVVVLPQGDFLKLLLSSSLEKARLLQTLFATEKWDHLTRCMRDKASALHKQTGLNDSAQAAILSREEVKDLAALQEKCKALQADCAQAEKALAAAQNRQAACNRAYDLSARAASAYDFLQKREQEQQNAQKRAALAAQRAQQQQAALPQAQALREQAAKLREIAVSRQGALEAARRLDSLQKEIARLEAAAAQNKQQLQQAEQLQKEAQQHWQKGSAFIDGLNQKIEQIPALSAAVEQELHTNAAAAVAADLKPGCPCPVCGSLQHPHPTARSEKLAQLQQHQAEANQAVRTLQSAQKRLKALEQQRENARLRAEKARAVLTELSSSLAAKEASQKEIAAQMQGSESLADLEKAVRSLRQQAGELEKRETQLRQSAADAQNAQAAAKAALEKAQADDIESRTQYQEAMAAFRAQPGVPQQTPRPDDTAARRERETAQQAAAELAGRAGHAAESLENAQHSCKQMEDIEKTGKKLKMRYEATGRLASLLSGKTSQRVPIQQFVLGIMLDDILSSANNLFSDLSGGRYRLLRKKTPAGGNALGGLDLAVLDAASGGERDVGTLSGGELFLASLSLAFGLSDVVQSYSGAVRLDALFIDEGFGSLDQETLDTAMGALLRLQKTGRTIGIISHVTELQTVMQKQIVVSRLPDGSSCIQIEGES